MNWNQIKINQKYKDWVINSKTNQFNVLEGGVRSAKTTIMILALCKYLETLPVDGLHLATGESIATAKSILMEGGSDLGIHSYFGPRAEIKQFNKKDALYITLPRTTQIIVFVGGANSDSWKSIHGMTFMSVTFTEVNILHRSFVERTVQRTLMTDPQYRKIFMDLNPMMPKH
jgi:hypothetical protein